MKNHYILLVTILISGLSFGQTVFINEIHYDNVGADTSEGVEIAGPAGTDLSTYHLTTYNGADGAVLNTLTLSGSIPNEDSGYGAVWFDISGLQNGPDGIALDNAGSLIQFLSYEGSFIATGGAANGLTSTDIGVSENSSTESDHSLQLVSSGDTYGEFTWAGPVWSSFGSINPGQTFSVLNTPTLTLYDGPADGETFVADPETPNPNNTDISFITSHFTMSSDAGDGQSGTGGDGFIYWYALNTNSSTIVDSGYFFSSNNPLITQNVNNLVAGESYLFHAELVNNDGFTPLSPPVVYSFNLTIATYSDVADLTELRAQTVDPDLYYRVTGQVINTWTNYDNEIIMYFQDGAAGIMVNDWNYATQGYNTGDAVSNIRGHLELVDGVLQLIPSDADWGSPTTTGNTPSVSTVNISTLLSSWENYESELVRITNATFADAGSTFFFGTNYIITDSSGSMDFACTLSQSNYIGQSIPSGNQDLVVIVSEFDDGINPSTVQVTSRNLADITLDSKSFEIDSFKLYPNPTDLGYVTVSSSGNSKIDVKVFDIIGKEVIRNTISNKTLDVSVLKTGVYLLKISQDDAITTKKLVIK